MNFVNFPWIKVFLAQPSMYKVITKNSPPTTHQLHSQSKLRGKLAIRTTIFRSQLKL